MALLEEVVAYLATEGLGTFGTDIFIGYEPVSPMNTITLYPTGGPKIGAEVDRDTPTMQVRVRNESYQGGWSVAWNAFTLLDTTTNFLATLKGRCFATQSQPVYMGRGENDEYIFLQDFYWRLVRP